MATINALFPPTPFNFSGSPSSYDTLYGDYEKEEATIEGKENQYFSIEDMGYDRSPNISFESDCLQHKPAKKRLDQQNQQEEGKQPMSSYSIFENPMSQRRIPIRQKTLKCSLAEGNSEIVESSKKMPYQSFLHSLKLLMTYGSGFKKLKGEKISSNFSTEGNQTHTKQQKLSTEEIMRIAGAKYVQTISQGYDDYDMPMHPFDHNLSGYSNEEIKDLELAHLLLVSAEKVGYQQFDQASKLLLRCQWIASIKGTAVQRIVFHFTEALRERIERETGRGTTKGLILQENKGNNHGRISQFSNSSTSIPCITCYLQIPFLQISFFTGIQVITENVASHTKIHLIDFNIKSGVQMTILMHALADRKESPIKLLKLSTVGIAGKDEDIENIGKMLETVAKSLNLPFSFKAVLVSDMEDIKEELFDIDNDDKVVVQSLLVLRTMISRPHCIENFMRVIRNIKTSLMVVVEVEANHNSPIFANRFIELLYSKSALFDCLETCMKDEYFRMVIEAICSEEIRNIVAMEGTERVFRSVKIEVWRAFFKRYGMMEMNLSDSSLYQASLMAKRFGDGNSCTLEKNKKCLIIGWKGTPIKSISAWNFIN